MRRVVQEEGTGCGIACIAMLAGTTYRRAKKVVRSTSPLAGGGRAYTMPGDLRRALAALGVWCGTRDLPRKTWKGLREHALVAINYNASKGTWHWVVYVPDDEGGYVIDPRASVKRSKRTDLDAMRIAWYRPVRLRGT